MKPGNREVFPEELRALVTGELPAVLPLEGWEMVTVHGQLDGVGPSGRHPDLSEITLAIPPAVPARLCGRCRGRGYVPDYRRWERDAYDGDPALIRCPDCTTESVPLCAATMLHALLGTVHCTRLAGHYDESTPPDPHNTTTWHAAPPQDHGGFPAFWNDMAHGAVPHSAAAAASSGTVGRGMIPGHGEISVGEGGRGFVPGGRDDYDRDRLQRGR